MAEILIAEDEANIREALADLLESEGYSVRTAADGAVALAEYGKKRPELLLLDVNMPKMNGFDVCREIRKSDARLPIVMLTARVEEIDKVRGLERGATDYVTKPYGMNELLARVAAHLRQASAYAVSAPAETPASEAPATFRFGSHTVDTKRFVLVDGRKHTTPLSEREVQLLRHFVDHPDEVAKRDDLLNLYWGYDYGGVTRTVDQHVAVLRKKLGRDGDHIETVPRIGYRFVK
ncbi:MAG: response regulator transcription factor [bacterium]|nr:response regulator transcription factor [bacterium]